VLGVAKSNVRDLVPLRDFELTFDTDTGVNQR